MTNDLTIAYLAGEADARDHYRAQIETLQAHLKLARIDADQQRARAEAAEAEVQRLASAGPIPGYWTREMMLAFAKSYDREAAAQIGEPDPWDREPSPFEKDWCDEAVACVTAGLTAAIMEGEDDV